MNGRPKIDGANKFSAGKKALWVIQADNTIVDNIELTGESVPDRNGAGIRLEGRNLTIRNSYFHNNQDGILTQEENSGEILIEYSEFASNGAGDGHSHNIYINAADSFTFRYSTSHDARAGHLLKSRASANNILYDFIYDGLHGDASYELDFPNACTVTILGSVVAQGLNSLNPAIISFGEEGPEKNTTQQLNNTVVNRQRSGTFVKVTSWIAAPAQVMNNIFAGAGTVIMQQSAVMTTNLSNVDPGFVSSTAGDFRLQPNSAAIHRGTEPPPALIPLWSNYNRTCGISRTTVGQIDIGAYEYGSAGGGRFTRSIELPVAICDPGSLLKHVQLALEAQPPPAAPAVLRITLDPAEPRIAPGGLFLPAAPEPGKLQTLLARLRALVGEDRVGSPEILNTHRPDAHRLRPCAFEPGEPGNAAKALPRLAFRYFRPAVAAGVTVRDGVIQRIVSARVSGTVLEAAGPWRTSGEWWADTKWHRDEWDVVLEDRAIYRLYLATNRWFLDGSYD